MISIGLRQLWGARAELLLAQGEPALALAVIERLIASALSSTERDNHGIPYLGLLCGEALLALNRAREAMRQIEPALAALEWRLGGLLGRALLAKGRRDNAAAAFAQVRQLAGTLAANT